MPDKPKDFIKKIDRLKHNFIKDFDELKVNLGEAQKNIENLQRDDIEEVTSDLNVVLDEKQLNEILRGIIGNRGERLEEIAIGSDSCCVDVSVGSSVAGPISTVGSSVSVPTDPGSSLERNRELRKALVRKDLNRDEVQVKVKMPQNINIK